MRFASLLLAALLMLGWLPTASSQDEEGQTEFVLEAHSDSYGGYFTFVNQTHRNPDLVVPAGATVRVTLLGTDQGAHNIEVEGIEPSPYVTRAGDVVNYTFTAPQSGSVDYYCVPHRTTGMAGIVRVAGSDVSNDEGDDETGDSPGVPMVAVLLLAGALVLAARRRA